MGVYYFKLLLHTWLGRASNMGVAAQLSGAPSALAGVSRITHLLYSALNLGSASSAVSAPSFAMSSPSSCTFTLIMKLQSKFGPFLVLGFWDKHHHATYTRHFAGVYSPLPSFRLPSEKRQKTGCSFVLYAHVGHVPPLRVGFYRQDLKLKK